MKLKRLTEILKMLACEKRIKILCLLRREGRVCVCDIVKHLGDSQPAVSRHLSVLKYTGFVIDEREGTFIYYSLSSLPSEVERLLNEICSIVEGVEDDE